MNPYDFNPKINYRGYDTTHMSAEEERMIKLAIKNSLAEKKSSVISQSLPGPVSFEETHETVLTNSGAHSVLDEIEEVKTYRPTEQ
jgi:hypothetical protein